jgi:tRNA threonylcarbamoyladenosine biosynthesis protein TsaE
MVPTLEVATAQAMADLGQRLGSILGPGDLVCLIGELGAGKTTLTQGIAAGLGIERPVTSPTFVTIKPYARPGGDLYHVDLYRVNDPLYLDEQGVLQELDRGALAIVEWAERADGLEDYDPLTILIEVAALGRVVQISGSLTWQERLEWLR